MTRGTTPVFTLRLDTDAPLDRVDAMWVTFRTSTVEVKKLLSDVSIDPVAKTVTVTLTQDDTLALDVGECEVQIRFRIGEAAYGTDTPTIDVKKILSEGVI